MTSDPTRPVVAVLGTGIMGAPMARNIAASGLEVRAWNRSRAKAEPLADAGVTVADTPAAAAAGADVLITMLFDLPAVTEVAPAALDALAPDALWLQMSTVGAAGTRTLAALADGHGVTYVDAPVAGTKAPAEQGTLVVLASAAPAVRPRCAPVFDAVGSRTVWVDGNGAATALKLVVNSWVAALIEGLAEAVALAERAGLDPQQFLDTIKGGPTDTPYAQLKGAAMLARDFTPSFTLAGAVKDTGLILELAAEVGVELAVTDAVHRHMARAAELGHGDDDMAATFLGHLPGAF
jgi:3-hydroxyisobutyrate dehydrogenase